MYSIINILGLAAGMAVAMLIALWIWDEVTFDNCPCFEIAGLSRIIACGHIVRFDFGKLGSKRDIR